MVARAQSDASDKLFENPLMNVLLSMLWRKREGNLIALARGGLKIPNAIYLTT